MRAQVASARRKRRCCGPCTAGRRHKSQGENARRDEIACWPCRPWLWPPCLRQPRRTRRWPSSSVRWTTSQVVLTVTIAASMAKIVEQALGGEYTVTVQPYQSPTVAMKAVVEGEIPDTADIGMTQFQERVGPVQGVQAHEAGARAHLVRLPMGVDDGDIGEGGRQVQVLEGFQRQAGILHPGRLPELAQLAAHLQDARLRLQARADRCTLEQGTIVGSAIYTTAGRRPRRERGAHGHQGDQPMSG